MGRDTDLSESGVRAAAVLSMTRLASLGVLTLFLKLYEKVQWSLDTCVVSSLRGFRCLSFSWVGSASLSLVNCQLDNAARRTAVLQLGPPACPRC